MTTPQPPRNDDAPDGRVAASLWRLRARLVTPPDAQRARSDLDRIMAVAREHAHDAPLAGATSTPHRHPDVEVEAGATVRALTPRTDAQRAPARWMRVSRVAAVTVLIVGVGGGIASAVGGDGGLLLRFQAPDGDVATAAPASDASADDADATSDGDDVAAGDDASDGAAGTDVEVVPDGTVGAPDGGDGAPDGAADDDAGVDRDGGPDGADDDVSAVDGRDAPGGASADSGPSAGSSNDAGGDGSGADRDSTDGGADVGDSDDAGSREDGASPDGDAPDDTIIALPEPPSDPGSVDGFGGARPCPDGADGCLPTGDEPATGTTDTDTDTDGAVDAPAVVTEDPRPDDDADSLDDLSARRAGS